ncbi:hypothetical protein OG322_02335 [Streptomyces sp. NBC_01260]|nr:hypothetical protein [Streptomyces sp. NBC_01285]
MTWFADAAVQVHVLRRIAGHGSLTTTQHYLHPEYTRARQPEQRSPRTSVCSARRVRCRARSPHPLTQVKDTGPHLVPRNDQGPVSNFSDTGPDLRLFRVGTTGFEPATP